MSNIALKSERMKTKEKKPLCLAKESHGNLDKKSFNKTVGVEVSG